jgi:serine/threonine protein kinase
MMPFVPRTQTLNLDRRYWIGSVFLKVWPDHPDLLRHELHALRQVGEHPNIVRPFGLIMLDDNTEGLCLEFVEGDTVENWQSPLTAYEAQHLGSQLRSALAHCHIHGIAHGDVNVSNVIVADGGRLCLVDFEMWRPATAEAIAEDLFRAVGVVAALSHHVVGKQC